MLKSTMFLNLLHARYSDFPRPYCLHRRWETINVAAIDFVEKRFGRTSITVKSWTRWAGIRRADVLQAISSQKPSR